MRSLPPYVHPDRAGGPADGAPQPTPASRARRPRPAALLALLVAGLAALSLVRSDATPLDPGAPGRSERGAAPTDGGPEVAGPDPPSPAAGTRHFTEAAGGSPVAGTHGPVRRYRVVVQDATGQDPADFAAAVDATLADPRSWIASGDLRVRRVSGAERADFTIYLATAGTSERMCAEGGLHTAGYTSCRLPGKVIINLDRWLTAVPDYAAPLAVYRAYVINHEVGHEFGELHEACPGPGRPAPVMQQQTYGLAGCVANAWPYLDGRRYAGDLIP